MNNVNDTYFAGYYKDIWRALIPSELTAKETEFMVRYFNLQHNMRVLDLMCGYGRHTLSLARKGISVVAIDNLDAYTEEIRAVAKNESLPINVITEDVMDFEVTGKFDVAICMGNSLNFFDEQDTVSILSRIYSSLLPGAHLLINTWSLAEIAILQFREKSDVKIGDISVLAESNYLFKPTRVETKTVITGPKGDIESRLAIDYVFSMREMELLLNRAGFQLVEAYSIPGKRKFSLGDPRAYLIAKRAFG